MQQADKMTSIASHSMVVDNPNPSPQSETQMGDATGPDSSPQQKHQQRRFTKGNERPPVVMMRCLQESVL
ncbi:hypothetical protein ABVT39_004996 [Epinephelus coioides]